MKKIIFTVCLLLALTGNASHAADERPGQTPILMYKITGLFSHQREEDLKEAVKKIPDVSLLAVDFENAEVTFTYNPAKVFQKQKADKIFEQLNNLVRNATNHTYELRTLSTSPKDKLTRVEIPVVGLDCKACCFGAYLSICKIDGVEQATASFKEGRVVALIDPAKTNQAALEVALKKANVQLKESASVPK